MPEPVLSISFSAVIVLIAAGAAIGVSFLLYRTTVPPVSARFRALLLFLRALGMFLLFLLLGEPLVSLLTPSEEPPTTLLLIDNSRSMTLTDRTGQRKERLAEALSSELYRELRRKGNVRSVLFDAQPRPLNSFHPDSLTLRGDQTDLAAAMRFARLEASKGNVVSAILLSDGNPTIGGSPLLETDNFPVPLFTVVIGDSAEQRDLVVRKILTNSIAYSGTRVPVHVQVLASGFTQERVEVTLSNDAGVLDRGILNLGDGTREYSVPLAFDAQEVGQQRYRVEISELPGEITGNNNRSTFFVKTLKNKVHVLLVAGAPSPDVAFIRRHLEREKSTTVTTMIERGGGQPYRQTPAVVTPANADCMILIGIPGPHTTPETLALVLDAAGRGTGILFIPSRTIDPTKLQTLEPILPVGVVAGTTDEIQVFFHPPEIRRHHALLKIADSPTDWSTLPPLFALRTIFRVKPESDVLAVSRIQTVVTSEPLFIVRNVNGQKSAALLGYGVWRWQMLGPRQAFDGLLNNAVRWLTLKEDSRRVRVGPTEELFTTQDPVTFFGQVYDESLQPVDNASVTVIIRKDGEQNELTLDPLGNGQYEGSFGSLAAGEYEFTASVTVNGTSVTVERGSFAVGGVNAEFLDTRANVLLLRQLAARTGGALADPSELSALIASLPGYVSRTTARTMELDLWNLPWTLGLIVLIFAFEWYLRKRSGML